MMPACILVTKYKHPKTIAKIFIRVKVLPNYSNT